MGAVDVRLAIHNNLVAADEGEKKLTWMLIIQKSIKINAKIGNVWCFEISVTRA